MKLADLMEFVDAGRNVLVATSSNVSDTIRQFANECGLDFDADQVRIAAALPCASTQRHSLAVLLRHMRAQSMIVDHANVVKELDDKMDADHTVITSSRLVAPERIASTLEFPVVFHGTRASGLGNCCSLLFLVSDVIVIDQLMALIAGVSHVVNERSPFVHKVLTAEGTAFSGNPFAAPTEDAVTGSKASLVSSVQINSNGRVTFAGSVDMFSDRFVSAK